jgi:hypothetical protein
VDYAFTLKTEAPGACSGVDKSPPPGDLIIGGPLKLLIKLLPNLIAGPKKNFIMKKSTANKILKSIPQYKPAQKVWANFNNACKYGRPNFCAKFFVGS